MPMDDQIEEIKVWHSADERPDPEVHGNAFLLEGCYNDLFGYDAALNEFYGNIHHRERGKRWCSIRELNRVLGADGGD